MKSTVRIDSINLEDKRQLAAMHVSGIETGFISSLGVDFVTALYEAITLNDESFGYVYRNESKILGFVVFTSSLKRLYRNLISKNGLKIASIISHIPISFKFIRKILEDIHYPSKSKHFDLPDAELLSIVIAPEGRGKGLASKLIKAGFEECKKRGIDKVKVLVAADNEPANKLYQKCGFDFVMEIDSHGVKSNIYVAEIEKVAG